MPARSAIRTNSLGYLCLAALFVISIAEWTRDAFDRFDVVRHADEYVREPFYLGDANWGAVHLQPEAEAAGMKYGDRVLAVNDHPIDGFVVYYGPLRKAKAGDRLRVQVRSPDEGAARDLAIELQPYSSTPGTAGASAYIGVLLGAVALPALCIGLGFWVAAVRITDRFAWLLLAVLLGLTAYFGAGTVWAVFGKENPFQSLFAGFQTFWSMMAAPTLMVFGIVFPERLELDRRFPWPARIIVGYSVLVSALEAINVGLWIHHVDAAQKLQRVIELLTGRDGNFGAAVSFIALVVCAGSLGWKTATAQSRDARRRLLLLDVGAVASVTSLAIILVANRLEARLPVWSFFLLVAMVLAFPLTMAYAIVVHRAMDVRVIVRQGVQYLLARGGVRGIQIAIIVALSIAAGWLLSGRAGPLRFAVVIAATAALVSITRQFADRVRRWVDRRFFREAYEADVILGDLASKVRTIVETGPLLETVANRIAESLHVPQVAILLNDRGAFSPAYALGYAEPVRSAIPEQGVTLERLQKQQHTLVRLDDSDSWTQLTGTAERAALEELNPELLLPLSLNDNVLGIMSLGPKQSEEPFSTTDIRLLESVAAQTGLALENGRLTEAIKAEVAAREKHRRELEIAHEVQERLFPQDYPAVPGLDYAGACRPALGVGGDYYDFILLSKTRIGIAIGDVSGKGIPAALLMATLRAYLRSQTIHRQVDLQEMIANLNALVYESSASNRYATFFYGEFDAASRSLDYVNAGHNAPIVVRGSGGNGDVLRLDTGGPVIGLMETCCYRHGHVALEPGDVMVAYTDGVSEAMNANDEEWGEERLTHAVRANTGMAASALIDRLMAAADAFVAGAPQHDDMTLIVMRIAPKRQEPKADDQ